MSILYKELLKSPIQKLSSSMKKSIRPQVFVKINGHKISALYDTRADICCMTAAKFMQVFPVGKRPKKINVLSTVTSASGNQMECVGVFPTPFEIDNKKFLYNIHVLKNLSKDFILESTSSRMLGWPMNLEIILDGQSHFKLKNRRTSQP
jgi:hypothetical protein